MKQDKAISILVYFIALFSSVAAATGIFYDEGPGPSEFLSIHGKSILIYGKGLYHHMSSNVAIQGIAQDYVTLFIAVPLLLISITRIKTGFIRWRFVLAGVLNYFLVTYLFYLEIAMYNAFFLVYVIITGTSFYAFVLTLLSFETDKLHEYFSEKTPVKFTGGFLIFMSINIAFLWLSIVVPPLLDGSVIPDAVEHYTTLTVQALDLSILLPAAFLSGILLIRKSKYGFLLGTVTLVFLPLLMTALVAKLIAMANTGINVIPAIFLVPVFALVSLVSCILLLRNIRLKTASLNPRLQG